MTFLEAYARFGPDTIAIGEAMGIPEHEADRFINARLNCSYAERLHARRVKKIAYAGKEPFMSEWAR
ncbi:hypothetical protein GOE04_29105 [Sinorhizobium medicae]|uniref:hypothetical protein n=1 Tax=Sinorhizobium medicae TaxID=110321 RepID=UPI000C7C3974|nr:hypothetical protein [Sinorhizobium medicae]MDX0510645.1 hypothetical protein [Sinorhizobium medicae]MDX0549367.1 hypothetical protein [Sinorhizobium medicae]MDX0937456.1 hypothetical protein [Sinorhizobium medicae]MDX0941689.1 hypothetical protein [Sinorhizobium medicae]MDX1026862.1 hypothetical protein [Sinorhizobium medicae]